MVAACLNPLSVIPRASGGDKVGYWGYLNPPPQNPGDKSPPRILGVNTPPRILGVITPLES